MYYKHISLLAFLLPILCYGKDNSVRIKELREGSYLKALELQKISKQISEAYEFIDPCRWYYEKQIHFAVSEKLRNSKDANLNREQAKKEIEEINENICIDLMRSLYGEGTFDYDLTKELFDQEHPKYMHAFDILKFFFMRGTTESYLLTQLVARYQICLRELLLINKELAFLEQ